MDPRKLSMPFWCVANPCGDPFGPGVMAPISSLQACDILCEARNQKLINYTSAHDDDLVPWDPHNPEDDQDQKSETTKILKALNAKLVGADLDFMMITCNLHGNPVFRNGGLTNPDPDIRLLAARKVMRAIRIGNYLGAKYLTYWVARDGFETQFAVPWERVFGYLRQGLNLAQRYAEELNGSIVQGTIEPKPNEPRGEMFLPTTGHALAFIAGLNDPSFWGVNPEILQHEGMTLLSSVLAVSMAAEAGKLFFLHMGNQKYGQFDNDFPVLTGMDGIKEITACLWALERLGWKGHVEFDNHMLRTDAVPGESIDERLKFIKLNVENYRMVEALVNRMETHAELRDAQEALWDQHSGLEVTLAEGSPDKLLALPTYYDETNLEPANIAKLDQQANKALLDLF